VAALTFTPYKRRYYRAVQDILFRARRVHTHLDWHETQPWLESQYQPIMRLAWQNWRLVGLLAASQPLNHSAWVRLLALDDRVNGDLLPILWETVAGELRGMTVERVGLLTATDDWIEPYLESLGFHYVEDVVTLARSGDHLPPPRPNRLDIRAAEPEDLGALVTVDHAAFAPPWQLAEDELRQAHRIASTCTLAWLDGAAVGYQLSTLYLDGAHLARLAVMPDLQGEGIGGALLGDALQRFFRRYVYHMTVNTQATNLQSQRLYTRFGFSRTGYDLPYWEAVL
jgi:ribosomal-protein-alanine N-acetyltransferase